MAHDQPTYASVPGIRVFGMMCVKPGNQNTAVRKPQPPKRDHYQQTPYYQRYKKHATNSPTPNEHERISRQTNLDDLSTTPSITIGDFTENYRDTIETDSFDSQDIDAEQQSVQDLNAFPHEVQTRIKRMIDQLNIDGTNDRHSRQSRSISHTDNDDEDTDDAASSRRSSIHNDMWPDVSWHEINRGIGDIH